MYDHPNVSDIDSGKMTEVMKEGWMSKLGGIRKNWKKRWFVAYKDALVCSRIPPLFFFFS